MRKSDTDRTEDGYTGAPYNPAQRLTDSYAEALAFAGHGLCNNFSLLIGATDNEGTPARADADTATEKPNYRAHHVTDLLNTSSRRVFIRGI
jgi:hypothetical protein